MSQSVFLENKLLLAMPTMGDPRFTRSVIYMCTHDASGAMGLVINHPLPQMSFDNLLEQLKIDTGDVTDDVMVHSGGPVEPGRGFVLHSADFMQESSLIVSQTMALTATVDILRAIAAGHGPSHYLLTLGYAGWGPDQLEHEVTQNAWMISEPDEEIIFNSEPEQKWPRAMMMLGIDVAMLSLDAGHA